MATIRKRNDKWQVQVRRQGFPLYTRSFINRRDAETWARITESELDRADLPTDTRTLNNTTVGDLLRRYRDTITPKKRSAPIERYRIAVILRHPIALLTLARATPDRFVEHREARLREVTGETARKDLILLRHLFDTARREWGLKLQRNPLDDVAKPPPCKSRTRRVMPEEFARLQTALLKSRNPVLGTAMRFAIETGMRRGELLRMEWQHVNRERRTLEIPLTKTGHPRIIPLSTAALEMLNTLEGRELDPVRVFPTTGNALRLAWERLRRRVGIADLRFHDLRHEAISRLFERGLSVPEVALISGHRDPRMLFRYTHLRPEDIAAKLA